MGGDDEDFGVRFAVFDELDPFFDKALLGAFSWLPDDEVDGGGTEKELVRGAVDALAAEIPTVEGDFSAAGGVNGGDGADFDAVRGGVFLPGFAGQRIHQTGFAHLSFAHKDEFSFIELDLRLCFGPQVRFNRIQP